MIVRHAGSSLTEHNRIMALAEMMAPIVAELRDIEKGIGKSHLAGTDKFLFWHAVRARHLEALSFWHSLETVGIGCPAVDTEYASITGEISDPEKRKWNSVPGD